MNALLHLFTIIRHFAKKKSVIQVFSTCKIVEYHYYRYYCYDFNFWMFAWKFHHSCGVHTFLRGCSSCFWKSKLMAIKKMKTRKQKPNYHRTKPKTLLTMCAHTKKLYLLERKKENSEKRFYFPISPLETNAIKIMMRCNNSCATAIIASFPHDDFSIIIILIVMLMSASVCVCLCRCVCARHNSS